MSSSDCVGSSILGLFTTHCVLLGVSTTTEREEKKMEGVHSGTLPFSAALEDRLFTILPTKLRRFFRFSLFPVRLVLVLETSATASPPELSSPSHLWTEDCIFFSLGVSGGASRLAYSFWQSSPSHLLIDDLILASFGVLGKSALSPSH